jgi:hypothetical protein
MCPICTVTVVAGLGISRLLGIDDIVSAIWIGGFILSFSFVTIDWIKKKWPKLDPKYFTYPTFVLMYLFVLIPFKLNHTIGIPGNTIWGLDKIVFGIFVGSVALLIGAWADKYQRKRLKKIFFPFQKVAFPVTSLIISSLIFYFITKH